MQDLKHLVWLDMEMTGLDSDVDTILEIAAFITDEQLTVVSEEFHLVINQPDEIIATMSVWCKEHHSLSDLTKDVQESRTSLAEAEKLLYNFIIQWCFPYKNILCGNSIYQDRAFLRKLMPSVDRYMHYRLIDVSSIGELINRWYPDHPESKFLKKNQHRALPDLKESLDQLRHYRKHFFIQSN